MYWKAIRWGGSAVIIILVVAAALLRPDAEQHASPPTVPVPAEGAAEGAAEPSKNFNLSP